MAAEQSNPDWKHEIPELVLLSQCTQAWPESWCLWLPAGLGQGDKSDTCVFPEHAPAAWSCFVILHPYHTALPISVV